MALSANVLPTELSLVDFQYTPYTSHLTSFLLNLLSCQINYLVTNITNLNFQPYHMYLLIFIFYFKSCPFSIPAFVTNKIIFQVKNIGPRVGTQPRTFTLLGSAQPNELSLDRFQSPLSSLYFGCS